MNSRVAIALVLVMAVSAVTAGQAAASWPENGVYLASGDSIAVGVGGTDHEKNGYVGRLSDRQPRLELVNVAPLFPGERSDTYISGGQMALVVDTINDPETDVSLVTLDIGGNDLLGLLQPGAVCSDDPGGPACQAAVATALSGFSTNYPMILGTIAASLAADPGEETFLVMTYYNPFGGTGSPFKPLADVALLGMDFTLDCAADPATGAWGLNDIIYCVGETGPFGVDVVDTFPLFGDDALRLTHIAEGDIHPNDQGHMIITNAMFQAVH